MRKLASIKIIESLSPIPNKDRIETARVDGWTVIVKRGEFEVGDLCVYVEIDSVLPEKPEFEFLRSKGFRIKTMKMAGVISQGICFPMSILPYGQYTIGDDVTALLGVTQYEPTQDVDPELTKKKSRWPRWLMRLAWFRRIVGKNKRQRTGFPEFVPKTDETRIQNVPEILERKNVHWTATEKLDGQSGTFALLRHRRKILPDQFEFIVCSRNMRRYTPDNTSYWHVAKKYQLEKLLRSWIGNDDWIAIQGECVGPGIQKNKYGLKDYDLYVFNVYTQRGGRMASLSARIQCEDFGLKFVPIIDSGLVLPDTVDEVLAYAHGPSAIGDTLREGIVFRSSDGKESFKAVDPLFLLKYDE